MKVKLKDLIAGKRGTQPAPSCSQEGPQVSGTSTSFPGTLNSVPGTPISIPGTLTSVPGTSTSVPEAPPTATGPKYQIRRRPECTRWTSGMKRLPIKPSKVRKRRPTVKEGPLRRSARIRQRYPYKCNRCFTLIPCSCRGRDRCEPGASCEPGERSEPGVPSKPGETGRPGVPGGPDETELAGPALQGAPGPIGGEGDLEDCEENGAKEFTPCLDVMQCDYPKIENQREEPEIPDMELLGWSEQDLQATLQRVLGLYPYQEEMELDLLSNIDPNDLQIYLQNDEVFQLPDNFYSFVMNYFL